MKRTESFVEPASFFEGNVATDYLLHGQARLDVVDFAHRATVADFYIREDNAIARMRGRYVGKEFQIGSGKCSLSLRVALGCFRAGTRNSFTVR